LRISKLLRNGIWLLAAPLVWSATPPGNAYLVHTLVSDQPGLADFTDANLINPWGIYTSAASPFWVSDAGTGLSTVYTSTGSVTATKPAVPGAKSANGPVTGGIANATGGFLIQGKVPNFLFVTADGTISGWASAVDATKALVQVDNSSSGAVYYGLAVSATTTNAAPQLYAANFHTGNIDVYDTNFKAVTLPGTPFVDPAVPAGYAPFNIWNLGGKLYVMWAKQDANKAGWVNGAGLGAVSIFDLNGALLQHLTTGGPLNAPWGVAIAPATFGAFAGDVLVGNFGDGVINAFDPKTGALVGALADQNGNTIKLPGLWALIVGNGGNGGDPNAIYFSAGGADQRHGFLGSIQAAPVITHSSVGNAGGGSNGIAAKPYISIYGASLSPVTRSWAFTDFAGTALPRALSGVSVTVNNKPAYVYYVSPKQIDVLTPVDTATGPVNVVVTSNGLVSGTASVTMNAFSPAFFLLKDNKSIAALHANGTLVGAATLYPNLSTPAQPNETIALFATGFGTTNPGVPDGQIISTPTTVVTNPTVTIGGVNAPVTYGGLVASGVYQFNVTVPATTPDGDALLVATVGTFSSSSTAIVTVKK
jgi:uncharacterized protein (TIGR03118 family)